MTDTKTSDTSIDTAQAPQRADKGTFVPLIFGGAVACALGFFGGQLDWVEERLGLQTEKPALAVDLERHKAELTQQADLAALQKKALTQQEQGLNALTAQVKKLAAEPPKVDFKPVMAQLDAQSKQITELAKRITDVEKRPMTDAVSQAAIAAYEKELDALQATVSAQRTEVENMLEQARANQTDAAQDAQRALGRAALARIVTAVDAGKPFADALVDLENSGAAKIPAMLKSVAADGVPALAQLQDGFAPVARAALATSRTTDENANTISGFLKRQLGARSVTPKEGDGADAVLSRAEAAVRQGRVGDALSELDSLPQVAKPVIADWVAEATRRVEAQEAAAALMQSLNTN